MIKEAIEYVRNTALAQLVERNGRQFAIASNGALQEIAARKQETTIEVATLTGFADMVKAIGASPTTGVICVEGPPKWTVTLLSELRDNERDVRLTAEWPGQVQVGVVQGSSQDLVLEGQLLFAPDSGGERDCLLTVFGSVVDVSEIRTADDLVTQELSGKSAIQAGLGWGRVHNPFALQPRAIYDEVELPTVAYVLRLAKRGEAGVHASLTPLRGTDWQTAGIRAIVARLRELLPDHAGIIAG